MAKTATHKPLTTEVDTQLREVLAAIREAGGALLLRLIIDNCKAAQAKAHAEGDDSAGVIIQASRDTFAQYERADQQLRPMLKTFFKDAEKLSFDLTPNNYMYAYISEEDGIEQPSALAVYCTSIDEPYRFPVVVVVVEKGHRVDAALLLSLLMEAAPPKEGDIRLSQPPGNNTQNILVGIVAEKDNETGQWSGCDGDGIVWNFPIKGDTSNV